MTIKLSIPPIEIYVPFSSVQLQIDFYRRLIKKRTANGCKGSKMFKKQLIEYALKALTLASSLEFSVLSALRSPSSFSIFVLSKCNSSLAIFNCSSVRWTFSNGVTRTRRRHHGQSRTCMNARTFRWIQRTANSWKRWEKEFIWYSQHCLLMVTNFTCTRRCPTRLLAKYPRQNACSWIMRSDKSSSRFASSWLRTPERNRTCRRENKHYVN